MVKSWSQDALLGAWRVTVFVHFGILEEERTNISGAVVGFKRGAWPDNRKSHSSLLIPRPTPSRHLVSQSRTQAAKADT
jgi:hypothetical protein